MRAHRAHLSPQNPKITPKIGYFFPKIMSFSERYRKINHFFRENVSDTIKFIRKNEKHRAKREK